MTRLSSYFLPTEREAPADAEAISHKLMVRAGLVRQLGAGMWTWLPAGWRSPQKAVQIIREEIDAIGGQEMLMPVLEPADIWKRSGRYEIDELFKLQDRRGADLVLALSPAGPAGGRPGAPPPAAGPPGPPRGGGRPPPPAPPPRPSPPSGSRNGTSPAR